MGYLGCKKCIEEKHPQPSKIAGGGGPYLSIAGTCYISCRHHGVSLEYIEESKPIPIEDKNTIDIEKKG